MKTETYVVGDAGSAKGRAAISAAVAALKRGEVVAIPTETVYGLAALPMAEAALRAVKGRDDGKPITWAVATTEAAARLVDLSPPGLRKLAQRFWPGPLTLVAARRDAIPTATLGIRVPAHPVALELLKEMGGPLLLSSANRSGEPDSTDAAAVRSALDGSIALILDGGPSPLREPSAVVSFSGTRVVVHREGVISRAMIERTAAHHVLIVCTGNTCRSPMAEALLRTLWARELGITPAQLLEHGGWVSSAGIAAVAGAHASEESQALLRARGSDLKAHRSQPARAELVRGADLVLALTRRHLETLVARVPDAAARIELLDPTGHDIADPIGAGPAIYRACLDEIERALRQRIPRLVRK